MKRKLFQSLILLAVAGGTLATAAGVKADVNDYRLYNASTGVHYWTENTGEMSSLVSKGWTYEGVGWGSVSSSATPVYRVQNPNNGDYVYTPNVQEYHKLLSWGWHTNGVVCYANAWGQGLPVYRLINNKNGRHLFTTSVSERNNLLKSGWKAEGLNGIGWYSVNPIYSQNTSTLYYTYSGQKGDVSYPQVSYLTSNLTFASAYQNNNTYSAYNNAAYNLNVTLEQDAKNADYADWQARQNWTATLNNYNLTLNADQATLNAANGQVSQYQTLVNQQQSYLSYDQKEGLSTTADQALLTQYTSNLTTAQAAANQAQAAYNTALAARDAFQKNGTDFVKLSYSVSLSSDQKTLFIRLVEVDQTNGVSQTKNYPTIIQQLSF